MKKKAIVCMGIGMLLLGSACAKNKDDQKELKETLPETIQETIAEESRMEESGNTSDIDSEESTKEEPMQEELSGAEVESNVSREELEGLIQNAVESFTVSSVHQYEVCDKVTREKLYQGFLDGEVKAYATKNQRFDDYYMTEYYEKFMDGTLEDYKAIFEKEFDKVANMDIFYIPFDDGNEMLCVQLSVEAAVGEHMIMVFQATKEGLILVSTDIECYVSGLYNMYPNGLLHVADRGNAACHYVRYYLLTPNCEKIMVGKWKDVDADAYCSDILDDYSYGQRTYGDVMITQANILDITINEVYNLHSTGYEYTKSYQDSDGNLEKFISDFDLRDGYLLQDSDFLFYLPDLFMKYMGYSNEKEEGLLK